MIKFKKKIQAYGEQRIIGCDGKCNKAWGIMSRPSVDLDVKDEDNNYMLGDDDLGEVPQDPGTYEGGHVKPYYAESVQDMNKWCFRQCERCVDCKVGEELQLKDWSKKVYNQPWTDEAKNDMIKDNRDDSLEKLDV